MHSKKKKKKQLGALTDNLLSSVDFGIMQLPSAARGNGWVKDDSDDTQH